MKKPMRIFLIENDEDTSNAVRDLLQNDGYQVDAFFDGRKALEVIKDNLTPCLILLDLLMPKMSGWDFMKEFLKLPEAIDPIPIYLFSVLNEKDHSAELIGAKGYISKPIDLERLLEVVAGHCPCEAMA